ncbi:hypothetical protein CONLIGDRAFT_99439 [Coniochaeta ligniaria NRRL 30616]|uniref:Cora-domain-containing protein n=1 Tax=Coniochaeta ligniaria NRRL 30616 TaxID=1408157 RepID=A0A1J7J3X0_9PEZI|nr:hypothetical protein CONLIGDRAFT_99439 [Coniochaeta ligniaria NRRL 30616]
MFKWIDKDDMFRRFGKQNRPGYSPCESFEIWKDLSFAVVWYSCGFGNVPYSTLSHGPLYGSSNGAQLVQKRIEVCAMLGKPREIPLEPDNLRINGGAKHNLNWTILVSVPPGLDCLDDNQITWSYGTDFGFGLDLIKVVHCYLKAIPRDWDAVIDHIEGLLVEGHSICSPHDHDRLLVDDENLTRSRKYFWIMTSIDEFLVLLRRTVEAIEQLYEAHSQGVHQSRDCESDEDEIDDEIKNTQRRLLKQFNTCIHRLEEQKQRAELFRSGLFNASAVMESRLSSRLSENVMLLTYVSIFYIPLGFITSLWAVPDTKLRANQLAVAMVIVGVVTYLITFNINTMSRAWTRAYHRKRDRIVESMKHGEGTNRTVEEVAPHYPFEAVAHNTFWDPLATGTGERAQPKGKWEARAERYENTFHLGRGETEPSEWFLAMFLVRRVLRRVRQGLVDFPLKVFRQKFVERKSIDNGQRGEHC